MISVIICTHNPREDYLRRTLEALEKQSLHKDQWELLLIDNASAESLEAKWDLSWHPNSRHVHVADLGLTPARLSGIEAAQGEILVFVDDDNLLACDYLEQVLAITRRLPQIGCFGAGNILPEFEVSPDPEVLPFTTMLTLRESSINQWSNQPDDGSVPWGAGLVVRKEVARQHLANLNISNQSIKLDRSGRELNSCGDSEFSWTSCEMGMGKGIFCSLQLVHLIPKFRLEKDYLLRIAEGHGFSHALLRAIHGKQIKKSESPAGLAAVASAFLKLQFSSFVYELQKWNLTRSQTKFKKQIVHSWNRGNDRAVIYVSEVLKNRVSSVPSHSGKHNL